MTCQFESGQGHQIEAPGAQHMPKGSRPPAPDGVGARGGEHSGFGYRSSGSSMLLSGLGRRVSRNSMRVCSALAALLIGLALAGRASAGPALLFDAGSGKVLYAE